MKQSSPYLPGKTPTRWERRQLLRSSVEDLLQLTVPYNTTVSGLDAPSLGKLKRSGSSAGCWPPVHEAKSAAWLATLAGPEQA
jgi:hypothetical protein